MTNIVPTMAGTDTQVLPTPGPVNVTTLDGSTISGSITGLTEHNWTADASGLFHTGTNLAAEWADNYTKMLTGHATELTPLQRMEGNVEAVFENTGLSHQTATKQVAYREDAQREFDAIGATMKLNQSQFGTSVNAQFSLHTYLQLEETLQGNETLQELATQGHGLNNPPAAKYKGYTNDFQNNVDNKIFFVGGGHDNGERAITDFFDDVALSHAPFASVMHNGVMTQLNQNGNFESSTVFAVASANEDSFTRVFVASDFSTDKTAHGAVVTIAANAAPADPVAAAGQVTTLDGSVISGTISGLTAHTWVADSTGLFHTKTDLAAEWVSDYHLLLQGAALTPMQRWEANAEAVLENTNASKLTTAKLTAFREDAQREFDAVGAAMKINAATLGISETAEFTTHSYLRMEETLRFNETLEELAVQGHGLNNAPLAKYRGFTENFQNRTDGNTLYVGGGTDNGEKAIASYFDDVIITHASFPTVWNGGHLEQLNQNGNHEDRLATVINSANSIMFTETLTAADFRHPTAFVPKAPPKPLGKPA